MNDNAKQKIYRAALEAKERNAAAIAELTDAVSLEEYRHLVRRAECGEIWTEALQTALREHQIITIPASDTVYWLDTTVTVPSNRRIEAAGATIRLTPECKIVMLRNEHTHDGTHAPIDTGDRDRNISIHGGRWEECSTERGGRDYAENCEGFKGVQTCMLFNNIDNLTMTDVTFVRTKAFSVQVGDLTDGVFENFFFIECFADGLHINGNSENLFIRNFKGKVGDDLVALNMYDWLGSSINFGPARNVYCEDLDSAEDGCKAMRLQPGMYIYDDGTAVDCALEDMYIRKIRGLFEYKLYLQTPPYVLGEKPESGGVGSANNLFFEDIHIVSDRYGYLNEADPITGNFGAFYMNSMIGYISLENIDFIWDAEKHPRNYLVAVGPMTWRIGEKEVFDPYASGVVDTLEMANIYVNGKKADDVNALVKIIEFDDINKDGFSSGKGKVNKIILDGKVVFLKK